MTALFGGSECYIRVISSIHYLIFGGALPQGGAPVTIGELTERVLYHGKLSIDEDPSSVAIAFIKCTCQGTCAHVAVLCSLSSPCSSPIIVR